METDLSGLSDCLVKATNNWLTYIFVKSLWHLVRNKMIVLVSVKDSNKILLNIIKCNKFSEVPYCFYNLCLYERKLS